MGGEIAGCDGHNTASSVLEDIMSFRSCEDANSKQQMINLAV